MTGLNVLKRFSLLAILIVLVLGCAYYFTFQYKKNNPLAYQIFKGPELNYRQDTTHSITLNNGNILLLNLRSLHLPTQAELYQHKNNQFVQLPDTHYDHNQRAPQRTLFIQNKNKVYLIDQNPLEYFDTETNSFIKLDICIAHANCNNKEFNNNKEFAIKAYNYNNKVLYSFPFSDTKSQQLFLYDLDTNTTQKLPPLTENLQAYDILITNDDKIIVFNGNLNGATTMTAEIYDPKLNKFLKYNDWIYIPFRDIQFKLNNSIITKLNKYEYNKSTGKIDKKTRKSFDKFPNELILNNRYSLFFNNKKTLLYDYELEKTLEGANLLHPIDIYSGVLELDKNTFLISNSRYHNYSSRKTQILKF